MLIIAIVIAIIAISAVLYFSPRTFLSGVDPSDVKSIFVFDGNTGERFVIDDLAEIKYIVENIQGIEMERYKVSVGYSGFCFRMSFNGSNDNEIDSFVINSADTIRDDPFFYLSSSRKNGQKRQRKSREENTQNQAAESRRYASKRAGESQSSAEWGRTVL